MKVYAMNISAIDPGDSKWQKYLSEKRAEKVNKILHQKTKAQSIGAELLLRYAVGKITGEIKNVRWETDENGKLYLVDYPEIYVNLSHSDDYAVCAVNDRPVGIDIEYFRNCDIAVAERFFAQEETEFIKKSANKNDAFLTVWTRKESLLKASGKGITVPLDSFSVLEDEISYEGHIYKFTEYSVKADGYKLLTCSLASAAE